MKTYLFLLLAICNGIFAQTTKNKIKDGEVTTYRNSDIKNISIYKNGKKNGLSREYINNILFEKGNYVDGKKNGEWITYKKGKVFDIKNYRKGEGNYDIIYCDYPEELKDGMSYVEKGSYTNGKEDGYFIEVEKLARVYWLDSKRNQGGDKKKIGKGIYIDGHKEGNWIYYNENGVLIEQISYFNGIRDGRVKIIDSNIEYASNNGHFDYFRDVQLKNISIKDSIDGKKNGQWQFNYEKGFKLIVNFKEGLKSGNWIGYNENDSIIERGNYINGMMDGEWVYYDRGGSILLEKGHYKNGIPDGEWIEINEETKMYFTKQQEELDQTKGNYINGVKDGKWEVVRTLKNDFFNTSPKAIQTLQTINYKNGEREEEVSYNVNDGSILSKCSYKNGIKQGEQIFYNIDGQIEGKVNYINGRVESRIQVLKRYDDGSRVEESMNNDKKRQRTYYNNKGEVTKQEIITN